MEAIKPRQIINYDAGIVVLIDLHQLNVKTTSDNTNQRHWNTGQSPCQRRTEPAEQTTRNIRFPNQMIEQIKTTFEQKGSGISAPVIEACRRRLTSEKRAVHQLKVMKNEHPAFFPPNRTIL